MTKKAAPKKKKKPLPKDLEINRRREWRFDFPLEAFVEGSLADGNKFKEETRLENISSGGAYFSLDSGVVVGSKLNLYIELPEKLADGKRLKLRIGGITVRLEKPDKKSKHQNVAVRFSDDLFKVVPAKKTPKKQ
ncbi:MAG: PilZ domain-containing protein [Candidatus Aminicenantes bacterium]|jgi:c-di-GMP-binding flagellar brake protein YcgR|nr:PilZ domain-containing protein [Candidatus Aminicenantes bacterium]MCJ7487657.1 PilZ domain-containing protein [Candidatus Aminicenantes bacterium]TFG55295.1 MAG: PilZ domain-containing protein [Candidatus Aminicenantes bacterium]